MIGLGKVSYTEEQITEYLDLARQVGHANARRELQYPRSAITGYSWAKARGVEIELNLLAKRASETGAFYSQQEELVALRENIDRIMDLMDDPAITADEMKKLTDSLTKAIQTNELVLGNATKRVETIEATQQDIEIRNLLSDMQKRNEEAKQTLNAAGVEEFGE